MRSMTAGAKATKVIRVGSQASVAEDEELVGTRASIYADRIEAWTIITNHC